jgi:hypothetical protein
MTTHGLRYTKTLKHCEGGGKMTYASDAYKKALREFKKAKRRDDTAIRKTLGGGIDYKPKTRVRSKGSAKRPEITPVATDASGGLGANP